MKTKNEPKDKRESSNKKLKQSANKSKIQIHDQTRGTKKQKHARPKQEEQAGANTRNKVDAGTLAGTRAGIRGRRNNARGSNMKEDRTN